MRLPDWTRSGRAVTATVVSLAVVGCLVPGATRAGEWFERNGPLLLLPENAAALRSPANLWTIHLGGCGLAVACLLEVRPIPLIAGPLLTFFTGWPQRVADRLRRPHVTVADTRQEMDVTWRAA